MTGKTIKFQATTNNFKVNGNKVVLQLDEVANEYFFPVKRKGIWGDDFIGDFYSLTPAQLILMKKHATMDDMKIIMHEKNEPDAIFNTRGKLNGK